MDCTISGKSSWHRLRMGPAFPLHRHKCIVLQPSHINDRTCRTVTPKVDELSKQSFVLPALIVSATKPPGSMSNYPIHCKYKKIWTTALKLWIVIISQRQKSFSCFSVSFERKKSSSHFFIVMAVTLFLSLLQRFSVLVNTLLFLLSTIFVVVNQTYTRRTSLAQMNCSLNTIACQLSDER